MKRLFSGLVAALALGCASPVFAAPQIVQPQGGAPTASPTFTGTVTLPVTGSTQCLQVNSSGVLSGSGGACGGTGAPGGSTTQVQYNSAGSFAGISGATTDGTTLTLVAPILGTPASVTLSNATGLPIIAGTTGTLTVARGGTGATTSTGSGSVVLATSPTLSGNTSVSSGSFGLSGNISAPAWTTAGIRYANVAATLTDTTSSGTVANAYTDFWGGNTIAASSATTFTNYYTAYFKAATAGTNVTLTNKSALGADSIAVVGTSSTALVVGPSGVTNPTLQVDASAASAATGVVITAAAAGSGVKTSVISSGADENWTIAAKGAGTLFLGSQGSPQGDVKVGPSSSTKYTYLGAQGSFADVAINDNGVALQPGLPLGWSTSSVPPNTTSWRAALTSPSAARIQLGLADAASPVAQTLGVQSVVAGTSNTAGANWTLAGSQGTGTGAGGSILLKVAPAGSTGTAQNALSTAVTIAPTLVTTFASSIVTTPHTVAGLPGSPVDGQRDFVIDADACTFASAVSHTVGTIHCPVYYDGGSSSWKAG